MGYRPGWSRPRRLFMYSSQENVRRRKRAFIVGRPCRMDLPRQGSRGCRFWTAGSGTHVFVWLPVAPPRPLAKSRAETAARGAWVIKKDNPNCKINGDFMLLRCCGHGSRKGLTCCVQVWVVSRAIKWQAGWVWYVCRRAKHPRKTPVSIDLVRA